jgi:hypothetical protein
MENPHRQAGPGQAVSSGGEHTTGQVGQVSDRGISMKDLDQEDVDGSDGVEEGTSPFMAGAPADGQDGGAIEKWGGVLFESAENTNNPVMH